MARWMERVMGIEPTLVAWEATVLPLNYTRADESPIGDGTHSRGRMVHPLPGSGQSPAFWRRAVGPQRPVSTTTHPARRAWGRDLPSVKPTRGRRIRTDCTPIQLRHFIESCPARVVVRYRPEEVLWYRTLTQHRSPPRRIRGCHRSYENERRMNPGKLSSA